MTQKRIWNILLATVATLLLINLGVMLSPVVHAIPVTQYRAVTGPQGGYDATGVQRVLDQQTVQGWQYIGDYTGVMIFKK